MIRRTPFFSALFVSLPLAGLVLTGLALTSLALTSPGFIGTARAQTAATKPAPGAKPAAKPASGAANQVLLLETAQRWQAFATQGTGKARTCYALSKARERKPANLKDVEGLLFISTRPGESVKNEISFVMNFDLKEDVEHIAQIGDAKYAMVAKNKNLWLRNPAEETRMLDAMRRATELEVRATSKKGNATADKYALQGMAQILKKVEDSCK